MAEYGVKVENRFAYLPSDEDGDNDENVEDQVAIKSKSQAGKARQSDSSAQGNVKGASVATSGADSKSKSPAGGSGVAASQKKAQTEGKVAGASVPSGKNAPSKGTSGNVPTSARGGPFRPNSSGANNNNQSAGSEQNYRNDDGGRPRFGGERSQRGGGYGGERQMEGGYRGGRGGYGGGGRGGGHYDRQDRPPRDQQDRPPRSGNNENGPGRNRFGGEQGGQVRLDDGQGRTPVADQDIGTKGGDVDRDGEFGRSNDSAMAGREGGVEGELSRGGHGYNGGRSYDRGTGRHGGYGHRYGNREETSDGQQATGYDGRGKRYHDRHSGDIRTGLKSVGKKDGGGQHNWGKEGEEQMEQVITALDANDINAEGQGENEKAGREQANEEQRKRDEEHRKQMEEDAKKMTLREYQEMQKQEKVQPQFNLRKANEGDTNWMKGVTVVGPKANQEESAKEEERRKERKDRSNQPAEQDDNELLAKELSEGIHYSRPTEERERGGRGGRGGGGFRGGDRGGRTFHRREYEEGGNGGYEGSGRGGGRGGARGGYDRGYDEGHQQGGYGGGSSRGGGGYGGQRGGGQRQSNAPAINLEKDFPALGGAGAAGGGNAQGLANTTKE